jgi:AraC-like DNA-binding protein
MVHLSVSQFDRKFKRLFQMTPQQYILRVRINAAAQTLATEAISVAEIAQQAGFYDQSYFTKQFRKQMGLTPSAYRRQYRETH